MSACKSCGAPVLWVRTKKGKAMPLDIKPDQDGNIAIYGGIACVISDDMVLGTANVPVLYKSHFSTCQYAAKHRKKP